jgi:AraC-like DNA-binding protein
MASSLPSALLPARRPAGKLRWPSGEALLCRADQLAELPGLPQRSFVALFASRDLRGRWEAAPAERRIVAAGPGPAPALALSPAAEMLAVAIEPSVLLEAAGRPWHPNLAFRSIADGGDDIAWLMATALRQECLDGGGHGPDYAAHIASALAVRLAARHVDIDGGQPLQGGLTGHRLRACLDHIERNLHRDVALAELAELAGLSTTHFARAFRRSLGEPPYRYFRRRRIERAKSLLAGTSHGIAQIALDCGYAAQSHFTSAFKEQTMTTPGAYRRTEREARARLASTAE